MTSEAVPEATTSVEIAAPPEAVWEALTTDEDIEQWLGAGTVGSAVGDDLVVDDIVTGGTRRGVVDEFSPARRLGYTWWPETRPQDATRVAITLEPTHDGTRVTVIEHQIPAATACLTSVTASMGLHRVQVGQAQWAWRGALLTVTCSAVPVR
jgi:uncharacterized protein YndB with AHSA1/START domain